MTLHPAGTSEHLGVPTLTHPLTLASLGACVTSDLCAGTYLVQTLGLDVVVAARAARGIFAVAAPSSQATGQELHTARVTAVHINICWAMEPLNHTVDC